MKKYYKIKSEKISEYGNKLSKGFVQSPSSFLEQNLNRETGVYYYWRLKERSQDEMIMTIIKIEDLEEVKI